MNVKILVVSHKKYRMPKDSVYAPIGVGGYHHPHQLSDDTSRNIASKNPYYCELTALYWGWKNLDCDYLGLAHYRRHFSAKSRLFERRYGKFRSVATTKEVNSLLQQTDIILPKKRRYWIETLKNHYIHTHYPRPLEEAEKIIRKDYPYLAKSWDRVMNRRWGHMFNMFIMKKELADEYCAFLFEFLGKLEDKIQEEVKTYDPFQARVYG